MKLFANRKIKFLFAGILWSILAFTLISALLAGFEVRNASYCILFSSLCMGAVILTLCFRYFREQHTDHGKSHITDKGIYFRQQRCYH